VTIERGSCGQGRCFKRLSFVTDVPGMGLEKKDFRLPSIYALTRPVLEFSKAVSSFRRIIEPL
jgi:hypothetical protein